MSSGGDMERGEQSAIPSREDLARLGEIDHELAQELVIEAERVLKHRRELEGEILAERREVVVRGVRLTFTVLSALVAIGTAAGLNADSLPVVAVITPVSLSLAAVIAIYFTREHSFSKDPPLPANLNGAFASLSVERDAIRRYSARTERGDVGHGG